MITVDYTRTVRTVMQLGDLHLQNGELTDQVAVLDWVVGEVKTRGVDLVIIGGDLAGMACPHLSRPGERQALVQFATQCVAAGAYVVVVRGNHDVPDDWEFLNYINDVIWCAQPQTLGFQGLMLHVLPYPDRSWVAAQAPTAAATTDLMSAALESIITGFEVERRLARSSTRNLLTGHFNTRGARASTGQPMIGTDVEVPAEYFAGLSVPLVLLNHIHLGQETTYSGTQVVHVGSPWPTTYGETEDKHVVVVDVETMAVERVSTPHVRRLTGELEWVDGHWQGVTPEILDGEMVRVRLKLSYDEGDDIDLAAARRTVTGAIAVKLERCPRPRRRERLPAVVAAANNVERFQAYEDGEGREVGPELLEMVRGMVKAS